MYAKVVAANYNDVTTPTVAFTIAKGNLTGFGVSMSNYTYGGIKSTPTIVDLSPVGSRLLPSGVTVTYYYNTSGYTSQGSLWTEVAGSTDLDAGTYYMYAVIGESTNYNGTTISSQRFTIEKGSGKVTLTADSGTIVYSDSIKESQTVLIRDNLSRGTITVSSSNTSIATVSYSSSSVTVSPGTSSGVATITVRSAATTNYAEATATYSIMVVKANNYSGTYNGNAHGISVTCPGATITYASSQNGTYSSTLPTYTNVGTYTTYYKVDKTGHITATGSKTVTITTKSVSSLTVAAISNYTYDGTAKRPNPTIKDGTKTLTKDTDYTLSYSNNVNIGTATCTITGKGNYTGTRSVTFKITSSSSSGSSTGSSSGSTTTPKDMSLLTVVLNQTTYSYNGSAKQPSVTVKDGTKMLLKGVDYTVSYSDNVNIGTAYCNITGTGSYTGTVRRTFKITSPTISNLGISYNVSGQYLYLTMASTVLKNSTIYISTDAINWDPGTTPSTSNQKMWVWPYGYVATGGAKPNPGTVYIKYVAKDGQVTAYSSITSTGVNTAGNLHWNTSKPSSSSSGS